MIQLTQGLIIRIIILAIIIFLWQYFKKRNAEDESSFDSLKTHYEKDIGGEDVTPVQRTPPDYDPSEIHCNELGVVGRHQPDLENLGGASETSQQYQLSKGFGKDPYPMMSEATDISTCHWNDYRQQSKLVENTYPNLEQIGSPSNYGGLAPQVWDAQGEGYTLK